MGGFDLSPSTQGSPNTSPSLTKDPPIPADEAKKVDRLVATLSDVAHRFSQQLDPQQLAHEIARQGAKLLGAERVLVYSVTENRFHRQGWFPDSAPDWPTMDNLPDEAILAIRHQQPMLTKARPDQQFFSSHFNRQRSSLRNSIFVPIVGTQNKVLGLIEFRNKKPGAFFNQPDLPLAQLLAHLATSAVDRGRLFGRMEEWSQSIEMLLAFNATVNQHLRPQQMVRQLVVNATGFVDAIGGMAGLAIYEDDRVLMEGDAFYFEARWHAFYRRWAIGQGVPGTVLQTEFPLLLDNYPQHPLADQALCQQFDLGPCICVAIKNSAEKVLGFFQLHRGVDQPEFTWQQAALLETLGNTAAVAIENARLVKSLEMKNEQIKNLSVANVRRLEMERQHIARELHDETGQVLIGLKLRLQLLSQQLSPQQLEFKNEIGALREQISQAAVRLKNLAKLLRPPTLDELGFEATLRQLLADYRQQVKFEIQLSFRTQRRFDQETETALYRIVQESLTNIIKYAAAQTVTIQVWDEADYVLLEIKDDGRGFDLNQSESGLGLIGMRERAKMLNANFSIQTTCGQGTTILISQISPGVFPKKDL